MKRFIILVTAVLAVVAIVISAVSDTRNAAIAFISEYQFQLGLAIVVVAVACLVVAGARTSRTNPVQRDVVD